jgi:hypothetical protein
MVWGVRFGILLSLPLTQIVSCNDMVMEMVVELHQGFLVGGKLISVSTRLRECPVIPPSIGQTPTDSRYHLREERPNNSQPHLRLKERLNDVPIIFNEAV